MTKHIPTLLCACLIFIATPGAGHAGLGDCGQPVTNGLTPTAADCLFILKAAVGSETCDPVCICDTNNATNITAADALLCLKKAVGQSVALTCPAPCPVPVTTSTSTTSSSTSSSTSTVTVTTTVLVTSDQADPEIATTDGEPKATSQEPALESVAEQKPSAAPPAAGTPHVPALPGATPLLTAVSARTDADPARIFAVQPMCSLEL